MREKCGLLESSDNKRAFVDYNSQQLEVDD
jgi:hypothetical protein